MHACHHRAVLDACHRQMHRLHWPTLPAALSPGMPCLPALCQVDLDVAGANNSVMLTSVKVHACVRGVAAVAAGLAAPKAARSSLRMHV